MATREVITLICDVCEKDDQRDGYLIEQHRVALDGHLVELDVCEKDWQRILENLGGFLSKGRRPVVEKVTRRKELVRFPGEPWHFSNHSLIRMGERHISPADAIGAVENPATIHPGLAENTEVRVAGRIKVVCKPSTRVIITVASRDEELEAVS